MMKLHPFVASVAALRFKNCFNPYSDHCEVHDHVKGAERRGTMLSAILDRAEASHVDAIWVGRDLGYRGGRRTGLALTDDVHAKRHAARWRVGFDRPTVGTAVAERTAKVVWGLLDKIEAPIFLWNVFPLHPHSPDDPFSNRQHNSEERRAGEQALEDLIQRLRPKRIVAIGNDAARSSTRVADQTPVSCVRHPSYGGQNVFVRQICELYNITEDTTRLL